MPKSCTDSNAHQAGSVPAILDQFKNWKPRTLVWTSWF